MELLVLSLLEWKMNPVIPLSFMSYIIKNTSLPADHRRTMEFTALFEHFCISLLSDLRFVQYQPSTVAAAVALHVMKEMDFDFCKNKLCTLLDQFNKEKFEACYQLILQASSVSN
jgi:cyclin D3